MHPGAGTLAQGAVDPAVTFMSVSIDPTDTFASRHVGPSTPTSERCSTRSALRPSTSSRRPDDPGHDSSAQATRAPGRQDRARSTRASPHAIAAKNEVWRSFLGTGYSDCITPPVIQRNVLENPGWYTQYTPYQAEIAQGRLEALLNFQTMVADLTALPIANASLLDESTAVAEAMHMMASSRSSAERSVFFVSDACHPQTIDVLRTRAVSPTGSTSSSATPRWRSMGRPVPSAFSSSTRRPTARSSTGAASSNARTPRAPWSRWRATSWRWHSSSRRAKLGADVAVGSAQRFGVPLGYGGPHAAFFACKSEHVRKLPGRIIGVSIDAQGKPALRMALQTREQHIPPREGDEQRLHGAGAARRDH